jgi:hypothetical protein
MEKNVKYRIEIFGQISFDEQVSNHFDSFDDASKKLKSYRHIETNAYLVKMVKNGKKTEEFMIY